MELNPFKRVARLRAADPKRKPDENDRLPPGQYLTDKFPVLTHGPTQRVPKDRWRFKVFGLVEEEIAWTYDDILAMPQVEITADFHCVTRWSQLDNRWKGVSIHEVMGRIRPRPEARFVTIHGYGGYTTNLPLDELADDDVLLAHTRNGESLSAEHGGPLRLIVPKLYAWKSAKWVNGLEFMASDRPGFWESYGYHMHGDPWTEERFS